MTPEESCTLRTLPDRPARWSTPIRVEELCTPIGCCICLSLDCIDPDAVAVLKERGYDQAPVLDGTGRVVGVIDRPAAEGMLGQSVSTGINRARLKRSATMAEVLDVLSVQRSCLVVAETAGDGPWTESECRGLLTISDLNRHPFRVTLYDLLGELESELARLVERTFDDPMEWLRKLDESHQVSLLGYWHFAKMQNIDIGPVAATTLTQLLHVVARFPQLRERLGFTSRSGFDTQVSGVPSLRNKVMHPVRPLIVRVEDVEDLKAAVAQVIDLGDRAKRAATRQSPATLT